jgi:hypothetical protein
MISNARYLNYSLAVAASFLMTIQCVWAEGVEVDTFSGKIGALEFKFTAPPSGWKDSPEIRVRAKELMRMEGSIYEPAFAFENQKSGALLIGTWSPFTNGFAVDAAQMDAEPPFFPSSWGIKPDQIGRYLSPSNGKEMRYSSIRVLGQGDGRTFAAKQKSIKTLGVFVTMPIQFENSSSVGSGMVSIDYRGREDGDVKNVRTPADVLINTLIENLKPQAGVRLISASAFRAKMPQDASGGTQNDSPEKSSGKLVSEQPQASSETQLKLGEVANTISKINIELLTDYKNLARDSKSFIPLAPTPEMMLKCGGPAQVKGASIKDLQDSTIENNAAHIKCESVVKQWIDWYNAQRGKK